MPSRRIADLGGGTARTGVPARPGKSDHADRAPPRRGGGPRSASGPCRSGSSWPGPRPATGRPQRRRRLLLGALPPHRVHTGSRADRVAAPAYGGLIMDEVITRYAMVLDATENDCSARRQNREDFDQIGHRAEQDPDLCRGAFGHTSTTPTTRAPSGRSPASEKPASRRQGFAWLLGDLPERFAEPDRPASRRPPVTERNIDAGRSASTAWLAHAPDGRPRGITPTGMHGVLRPSPKVVPVGGRWRSTHAAARLWRGPGPARCRARTRGSPCGGPGPGAGVARPRAKSGRLRHGGFSPS